MVINYEKIDLFKMENDDQMFLLIVSKLLQPLLTPQLEGM